MAIPASNVLGNASTTTGDFQTAIEDLRDVVAANQTKIGGLVVEANGSGDNLLIKTKDDIGSYRTVMKIDSDGSIVCFGNVTFNNGTIS